MLQQLLDRWSKVRIRLPGVDSNSRPVLAIVAAEAAESALELMRAHPLGAGATIIGSVTEDEPGLVTMKSDIGATRIVDMLSGEQLPRIC